jgi:tetratricopeptide (TPR) repeat protein
MLGTPRVIATLMASALLASPVLAQPPTPAEKQQAQDLVKQAIAKSQANEHSRAIELYLEAYEIVPLPTLLSNVGTEYQADNKPVEALKYFCMYLDKDPNGPLQTYARGQARQIQDDLGHEALALCATPPAPTAPRPTEQTAATETRRDSEELGVTKPARRRGDPGTGLKVTGLVAVGLGVAALGGGLYFGNRARTISDDISMWPMNTPWPDDIADYEAEGARAEQLQIVGLAVGGALVVSGAILYVVGRSKTSAARERVSLTPTANPRGGGVVFAGSF